MQDARKIARHGYAQNAATRPLKVHRFEELRMALDDKARGQQIARLRKRRRLTQQKLADQLGVAYRTVQGWEGGTMPDWVNLEKLAAFFEVRPEDLIGDGEFAPIPTQADRIEHKLDLILEQLGLDPESAKDLFEQELEQAGALPLAPTVGTAPTADTRPEANPA